MIALLFLQLVIPLSCPLYFQLILPCFLLAIINSPLLFKRLQMYPLYLFLDSFDLLESKSLISLVVVAVLVECVDVLDLLDLEPVVDLPDPLHLLVCALDLVLDVRQVRRTLQLVLPHLQLHSLH